jgi:hypothetical protein
VVLVYVDLEFIEHLVVIFRIKSGFLNADELKAYLKSVDANGDLTEQELKDGAAFLDKNKDGEYIISLGFHAIFFLHTTVM